LPRATVALDAVRLIEPQNQAAIMLKERLIGMNE
jgi:hypothetical protein